jgi:hypothetical protein
MSKRKVVVGGYKESSDGSESDNFTPEPLTKKPWPVPTSSRLGTTLKPGMGEFQLPQLNPPFARPGPVQLSMLQPKAVEKSAAPDAEICQGGDSVMAFDVNGQ